MKIVNSIVDEIRQEPSCNVWQVLYIFVLLWLVCFAAIDSTKLVQNTLNLYQNKYLFSQMSFTLQLQYKYDAFIVTIG